jgi:hypothetical protein
MDDVHAEHAIGRGVGDDLHEARGVARAERAAVDRERELPVFTAMPSAFACCSLLPTQAISGEV